MSRLVFWDHRGTTAGRRPESPERASIDQLGADLHAVMTATTPGDSPVVLVGHSMGGMTIMALADQRPELFGTKVIGAALISTAAEIDPTVAGCRRRCDRSPGTPRRPCSAARPAGGAPRLSNGAAGSPVSSRS